VRFDDPALREGAGLHLFLFGPGQGESIALRSDTSGWIVIDSLTRHDGKKSYVNPALALLDADDAPLACVVLTHPHADHAEGIPNLVDRAIEQQATVACVERFTHTPKGWDRDPVLAEDPEAVRELGKVEAAAAAIDRAWQRDRAPAWRMNAGDPRSFGDVTLTALWPDDAAITGWSGGRNTANTVSTPHLVEWDGLRLLLGADLPCVQWRQVHAQGHGKPLTDHAGCKVPHHGSIGAQDQVWTIGTAERSWLLTGYGNSSRKLPDLSSGGGAAKLLEHVERMALTSLPFATSLPPGPWSLTPGAALTTRVVGRDSGPWGVASDAPVSGPLDGWVHMRLEPSGSADVTFGDRAGTLVRA
jgi:glyoxylase-like metal-dependent hydrolase (beta-lactamase superfamily II)